MKNLVFVFILLNVSAVPVSAETSISTVSGKEEIKLPPALSGEADLVKCPDGQSCSDSQQCCPVYVNGRFSYFCGSAGQQCCPSWGLTCPTSSTCCVNYADGSGYCCPGLVPNECAGEGNNCYAADGTKYKAGK